MSARSAALLIVSVAAVTAACGSSGTKHATATTRSAGATSTSAPSATTANYHPTIDPGRFTTSITNKYFPLKPGTTTVYDGPRDGQPHHTEMTVTSETKTIMGVRCVVVRDVVTSNGALVEKTTDWYAQAANGDVWYFGEATAEYTNGAISNTKGSWEAGVDNAQPGVVMKGTPAVGDSYRQEYRPGEAEDMAKVLRIGASIQVPGGTFQDVVVTEDRDPLNPDKIDEKHYAPGIGLVYSKRDRAGHHEESSYVKTTTGA
jgi:hypothetical protein